MYRCVCVGAGCVCVCMCTLYLVPCTLYPVPCTLYLVPCTLYLVPCTLYLVPCTLYPVPCTLYLVPCTLYLVPCTLYLVPCTLYLGCIDPIHSRHRPGTRRSESSARASLPVFVSCVGIRTVWLKLLCRCAKRANATIKRAPYHREKKPTNTRSCRGAHRASVAHGLGRGMDVRPCCLPLPAAQVIPTYIYTHTHTHANTHTHTHTHTHAHKNTHTNTHTMSACENI